VSDPYLLHIFSPTKYVSPFDINMAYEANFDAVIPYCNIELDEVPALTQDTIFSRRPEGVKRTGIFIGGREFDTALEMMEAARKAMVPPFEVSLFADPSGAITTAAAMVAIAEERLKSEFQRDLGAARVIIFGGTGPVGTCVALLAALCDAEVSIVSHQGAGAAQLVADRCARRYGLRFDGADGSTPEAVSRVIAEAEVVFNTAKAGIQVVDGSQLRSGSRLRVVADANAVPPSGVAGVAVDEQRARLRTAGGVAIGVGALAIGDIKYRVHTRLLEQMYQAPEPVYLAYREAFEMARQVVAGQR
jgi:methylene-tetrahydromethanopterin dehydrogenase